MSESVVNRNEMSVTTSAVDGHPGVIVVGFHSLDFSQAVYIPVADIVSAQNFAMGLYNGIVTAAEAALGIPAASTETASRE